MNRSPLVIGNWKMHKTPRETEIYLKDFLPLVKEVVGVEFGIAPPFVSILTAGALMEGTKGVLCAQNVHWEREGAFTGEISPYMLKESGVEYVIIGHSERRHIFGETDEMINRKVKAVSETGMKPVLCVGEKLEERESGNTLEVVKRQLREGLKGVRDSQIVIAYEPVWAIGTGRTATPEIAEEVHEFIREELKDMYGDSGQKIRILYGGSVKPENVEKLIVMKEIDGFLVGGASLTPSTFAEIIKTVERNLS